MVHVVVEQKFDFPLTPRDKEQIVARLERFKEQYRVRWVRSYLASGRRRMIGHFEATDPGVVRAAYTSAGMRFERAWAAEVLGERVPSAS
jgi:hypothetical protein